MVTRLRVGASFFARSALLAGPALSLLTFGRFGTGVFSAPSIGFGPSVDFRPPDHPHAAFCVIHGEHSQRCRKIV